MREKWPLLAIGFALALCSGPGQTFFIALSAGDVRSALRLSDGDYGALYSVATLCSAATLIWLGKLADVGRPVALAVGVLSALAVAALAMASAQGAVSLAAAIFMLRLFGQGMLSHLMATNVARWFHANRGKALSVSALGFAAGEASLPLIAAAAMAAVGWRAMWTGSAIVLAAFGVGAVLVLARLAQARGFDLAAPAAGDAGPGSGSTDRTNPSWTRAQVLRDPRFFALLPGLVASPAIITGVLFHQVRLAESKGWTVGEFATLYPFYAVAATAGALAFGALIDRIGAARALPLMLVPLAVGLGLMSVGDTRAIGGAFMALMGASGGAAAVTPAALWSEMYGVRHIGAIRALSTSVMVFGTALMPAAMGALLDRDVSIETQLGGSALYAVAAIGVFAALSSHLKARHPTVLANFDARSAAPDHPTTTERNSA